MFQVHVIVSGFVQGVGFRRYLHAKTKNLDVAGWVKNLSDGRVEALFQGQDKKKLESLIEICRRGPFFAEVKDVSVEWEEPEVLLDKFEIKTDL